MSTSTKRQRKGKAVQGPSPRGRIRRPKISSATSQPKPEQATSPTARRANYYTQADSICDHIWSFLLAVDCEVAPHRSDLKAIAGKLKRWFENDGRMTLDEAFGVVPPAGVGRIDHVLKFKALNERDRWYRSVLVNLRVIGFNRKEACFAARELSGTAPFAAMFTRLSIKRFTQQSVERFHSDNIIGKSGARRSSGKIVLAREIEIAKEYGTLESMKNEFLKLIPQVAIPKRFKSSDQ